VPSNDRAMHALLSPPSNRDDHGAPTVTAPRTSQTPPPAGRSQRRVGTADASCSADASLRTSEKVKASAKAPANARARRVVTFGFILRHCGNLARPSRCPSSCTWRISRLSKRTRATRTNAEQKTRKNSFLTFFRVVSTLSSATANL
jgi:hypothetical protein